MANQKISQFANLGANQLPAAIIPIVQGGQNYYITLDDLFANMARNTTSKIYLIDGDLLNVLKLGIKKNGNPNNLNIIIVEALTDNRNLTIVVNDGDRVLTIAGDSTISGVNTGDQLITLTGDVTGSGLTTFVATIANQAVTYAKMQLVSATKRLLGRVSAGAGSVQEILLGSGFDMNASALLAPASFIVAVTDEVTALTTGTAVVTFRAPYGFNLTDIRASLTAASTSGLVTVDVKKNGVSIFSTLLTIDANELTSLTAATPYVFSSNSFSNDDSITINITTAGTNASGLKVAFIGTRNS
jgi:hypothetical protein